jgi:hypothetical protein
VFVLGGTSNMLGAAAEIDKLPEELRQPLRMCKCTGRASGFRSNAGRTSISVASAAGKSPAANINNIVKQSAAKGRPIIIHGMLLDVSYRDGIKEETAKAYGDNLVRWVDRRGANSATRICPSS